MDRASCFNDNVLCTNSGPWKDQSGVGLLHFLVDDQRDSVRCCTVPVWHWAHQDRCGQTARIGGNHCRSDVSSASTYQSLCFSIYRLCSIRFLASFRGIVMVSDSDRP